MTSSSSECVLVLLVAVGLCRGPLVSAHGQHDDGESHSHDHGESHSHDDDSAPGPAHESSRVSLAGPIVEAFRPFSETVTARVVGQQLVIESTGLPDHPMMIGIRSWQQQVPLPQPFTDENAWRLPLKPQRSSTPISVLEQPLRGAIALAVNGVPIFCALNNRGEDTYLAGELDQWGGHCGRGDDYHYHIAPVHLEAMVGVGNPIGYALDGYPILGFTEADGSAPEDLDEFNGHEDADGNYHYHATKTFPYTNGGIRGVVTMDGSQIKQPRDSPIRPGQSPLRGATITGFSRTDHQFDLKYELGGKEAHVKYSILDDGRVEFAHIKPTGESSTATYRRGERGAGRSFGAYGIAILVVMGISAGFFAFRKYAVAHRSA